MLFRSADDLLGLDGLEATALVFVTHSVEEAVYMASRVLVLSSAPGRLTAEVPVPGPSPRPPGFRGEPAFAVAGEAVSHRLEAAFA